MKKYLLFLFLATPGYLSWAQRGCATDEVNQQNKSQEQILREQQEFEEWLIQKKVGLVTQNSLQDLSETTIYQIPVVVHIIHNGESIGEGLNIAYEQIISQIEVLNRDFRHLNPDSINTPDIFKPFMADIGFEFVLVKRDPKGLPTQGITRTNGYKDIWSISENGALKSLSYWPSQDYLNIWVTPISGYYGYAEFPFSSIIEGAVTSGNPLTDGVVISTTAFGSVEFYPEGNYQANINLGRTATHEIGHFFGLHHIWGNSITASCTLDDFVADTPNSGAINTYCPSVGFSTTSCGSQDMFMNYMDYVNDDCMNLFTLGQKERMVIVINNSPRRASLLTSSALEPPPPIDAAITAIPSPGIGTCNNYINPTITVYNSGVALITKIDLSLLVNNTLRAQQVFSVSLGSDQDTTLIMPDFRLVEYGQVNLSARINSTNSIQDDNPSNNTFNKRIFFSEILTTINENFGSWPQSWAVRNDGPLSKWDFLQAPNVVVDNTAAVLNYYQNSSVYTDHLILPVLDLSTYTNPYLLFDHAYGEIAEHNDILAVLISLDCGITFPDTLFLKSGKDLATTQMPVGFTPSGPIDWRTTVLDLSNYISQPIQLAFTGSSDGGNNIYIDNILIVEQGYEDLSLKGMLNESGVYSSSVDLVGLQIENKGTVVVNKITVEVSEGTKIVSSETLENLNLLPGQQKTLFLNNTFTSGKHHLIFSLLFKDEVPENNRIISATNFLAAKEQIPYRENFDNGLLNNAKNWTVTSPNDVNKWQTWPLTGDFVYYPAYGEGDIGLHDWLVMPLLDFSEANQASMSYKVAYARNDINNELLNLWVSTNKGESFDYLMQSLTSRQMSSNISSDEWSPATAADWLNQFIDLSEFAGEEYVLVAFESIDGNGSNIYLDDIELFVSSEENQPIIETGQFSVYPNPIIDFESRIHFNLSEKQDLEVRVIDINGNVLCDQKFTNVLNQSFLLKLTKPANGLYLIQVFGPSFNHVTRIIINK